MPLMLPSVALHTDLYQLTMAQGYWKLGLHNREAVFEIFYRENPFQGGYAIACGLDGVVELIDSYAFSKDDLEYLADLKAQDGSSLFQTDFLKTLQALRLTIDLDAIEEGTLVFPKEPLLRVQGPIWQCQLLETALLNLINFPTLIATKASRVCFAAAGDPVIEFGLRRAQGPNGGLMASRAAFVGGVDFTSNVLAGKLFGIGVRGTHAHSWIMAFDSELESFNAYADAMPNNCIFLVDTYKTLEGVQHAIEVGHKLKAQGHAFLGIRLDSGDMLNLSLAARTLLDQAGFTDTFILASSDLDEYEIQRLKAGGAKIDMWGVGTRLVTGHEQSALGGVYKLVSIQDEKGHWHHKYKLSDDPLKQTYPGIHAVRRYLGRNEIDNSNTKNTTKNNSEFNSKYNSKSHNNNDNNDYFVKDLIYSIDTVPPILENEETVELLCPIFRKGKKIYNLPDVQSIQSRTYAQLEKLPKGLKELRPKTQYKVELFKK